MALNTNYLRKIKGENLRNQYSLDTSNKVSFQCYRNATILPFISNTDFGGLGGVIDENGQYIEISAEKFAIGKYDIETPEFRNEKVCYCGYLMHQWGHFLLDSVSRIWFCIEHTDEVEKFIFYTSQGQNVSLSGNFKEFFELLGIWEKVEIVNYPVRFSEVVIPERGFIGGKYFSPDFLSVFDLISEHIVIDNSWERFDKIYFTKNQFKKSFGADIGYEMLDDYFSRNGFRLIAPETISLSQLIYLIRNAKIIASGSGSVCHNMLFANQKQELIILEKTVLNNDYQIGVNIARCLDVTYIDANIALYSVEIGYGPFIISYKGRLERFTQDRNWLAPNEKYTSEKYLLSLFKKYMKQYRRYYHARWILCDWMLSQIECLNEAYLEGESIFRDYIYGLRPYFFYQYFQIRFIKQAIKRFLRR